MSISDPIADALTRIRNAQSALHETVEVKSNTVIESILGILQEEGFVQSATAYKDGETRKVKVELKYYKDKPVIRGIKRVSKPGRRVYTSWKEIQPFRNNIGLNIFSTPKGVLSGKEAKYQHTGGEYLCRVW
jgi:small subunit ribosomal protein S8